MLLFRVFWQQKFRMCDRGGRLAAHARRSARPEPSRGVLCTACLLSLQGSTGAAQAAEAAETAGAPPFALAYACISYVYLFGPAGRAQVSGATRRRRRRRSTSSVAVRLNRRLRRTEIINQNHTGEIDWIFAHSQR